MLAKRREYDVNVIYCNSEFVEVIPFSVEVAQGILYDLTIVRIAERARSISRIQPVLNPFREESKELAPCSLIVWLWMAVSPYPEFFIPLSELRLR